MTTRTALFALLTMWGVGACTGLPALAEEAAAEPIATGESSSPLKRSFTNRVWAREPGDTDLPGAMIIFLTDGTLLHDSCWETHRLSQWKMTSDNSLSWNEDGMEITADIVSVNAASLTLALHLGTETVEERYTAAAVPYLCPDMPKD